jgi:hypothetical protein
MVLEMIDRIGNIQYSTRFSVSLASRVTAVNVKFADKIPVSRK